MTHDPPPALTVSAIGRPTRTASPGSTAPSVTP